MAALKAGDSFPSGVSFGYIPYTEETGEVTACGVPTSYDASAELANKKVVIVSVPGAFTPTCQNTHLPGFLEKKDALKAKGVSQVLVIAFNDPFVMSAWGKANGCKDDFFLFLSDSDAKFSQSISWTLGPRTARYAIAVDHGKVLYAAKEDGGGVGVSGVDAVMAHL